VYLQGVLAPLQLPLLQQDWEWVLAGELALVEAMVSPEEVSLLFHPWLG